MSSQTPVKMAVIGTGLIGPRHALSISANPEAQLVCIVDPNPAAKSVAAKFKTTLYPSIADMLSSPHKPDAAIVCTPNHTHVALSKELLDGGVHVLVEKPISTDVASGHDLVTHAEKSGLKLLVGHHRRFNPYVVATNRALEEGSLGEIIAVNGLWTTFKPSPYFDPPTEWRRTSTAGTVLLNLIHEVDIMHHLFGPVVRIHAEKTVSQRGYDAEEGAAILFRFASGVVGTFLLSDAVPSPYSFEQGTGENPLLPRAAQDFYRIFGTDASLSVPDMRRWSYDGAKEKSWLEPLSRKTLDVEMATPFDLQVAHFIRVVRGQEEPSCSGQAGLQAMIVCDAVRQALKDGGAVDIKAVPKL
ncbi:hypothetical protein B0A49_04933 [Cryomyces minteri]|uniref:Gfo/Idh/MocA-like oxidoreductase N-terminal domain-containing protein n=1 Tax=Cryomyces minteri TaxID=331657 RepID=A0A4V6WL33_9PEZI|nr:hypothetical protein B0A49_04933 [Cryomyces minteri]